MLLLLLLLRLGMGMRFRLRLMVKLKHKHTSIKTSLSCKLLTLQTVTVDLRFVIQDINATSEGKHLHHRTAKLLTLWQPNCFWQISFELAFRSAKTDISHTHMHVIYQSNQQQFLSNILGKTFAIIAIIVNTLHLEVT